jgi:hypothetical protein
MMWDNRMAIPGISLFFLFTASIFSEIFYDLTSRSGSSNNRKTRLVLSNA